MSGKDIVKELEARGAIQRVLRFLEKCATNAFFGKVTVSFQNGRVYDVRIEQTRKVEEL